MNRVQGVILVRSRPPLSEQVAITRHCISEGALAVSCLAGRTDNDRAAVGILLDDGTSIESMCCFADSDHFNCSF